VIRTVAGEDGDDDVAVVTCLPANPNVVSGGFANVTGGGNTVQASYPSGTGTWTVVLDDDDSDWDAYAICSS
jgi:hypothetical protein